MKPNEELAVLTALQKLVKRRLDEVRAKADDAMLEAYEDDGVTKKALKVGGVRVGDYIVTLTSSQWAIENAREFEEFALAYGFADIERSIKPEYMAQAVDLVADEMPNAIAEAVKLDPKWADYITNVAGSPTFLDSGEVVPGVKYVGQRPKGTQVRGCDPKDVAPILQQIGGADALLLAVGANDEVNETQD